MKLPLEIAFQGLSHSDAIEAAVRLAEDTGDELVWHDNGTIGAASAHVCTDDTDYTIDRFLRKADLGKFGARNFVLGATHQLCAPSTP